MLRVGNLVYSNLIYHDFYSKSTTKNERLLEIQIEEDIYFRNIEKTVCLKKNF